MRVPNYRWYWFSGLGMTGAQQSQRLTLAWLILELTDSLGQLGLMVFVMGVPMSIVSLWGGVLADRWDRRLILMVSQAFTGINLLILAALTVAGMVEVWHVYVSSFGLGVTQALTMPARNALIRSLVQPEEIKSAVALNAVQAQSAQVIWPSIAGGIISLLGVGAALVTTALLALLGIVFLIWVRPDGVELPRSQSSQARDLAEGLHYSFSAPRVGTLMGMAIVAGFFAMPYMSLAPGFARDVFHFSAGEAGLLLMASGVGAIVGSVYALMVQFRDNLRVYFVGCTFLGLSVAGVAASPWPILSFLPAAGFGFCISIMIVSGQTLFQAEVPPQILGRVNSIWSLVGGIGFLASLPVGIAGDVVGIRGALMTIGLILFFASLANGLVRTSVMRPRPLVRAPARSQ
jgi:MFS family permease